MEKNIPNIEFDFSKLNKALIIIQIEKRLIE